MRLSSTTCPIDDFHATIIAGSDRLRRAAAAAQAPKREDQLAELVKLLSDQAAGKKHKNIENDGASYLVF